MDSPTAIGVAFDAALKQGMGDRQFNSLAGKAMEALDAIARLGGDARVVQIREALQEFISDRLITEKEKRMAEKIRNHELFYEEFKGEFPYGLDELSEEELDLRIAELSAEFEEGKRIRPDFMRAQGWRV